MPRTLLVALALISVAACGSDTKQSRAATHSRATPHATRSTKQSRGKAAQRSAARRDTSSSKNPLTNH
jgi:hypothetical protein